MHLFERHPLPWTRSEKPEIDYFWVRDAKGQTVVLVSAVDETSTESVNDQGGAVRTIVKTLRPGAEKLAAAIAALPEMLSAITDAHASLTGESDEPMADRLEALIERLG